MSLTDTPTKKMSRATPEMRDLAERLIAFETRENGSAETKISVALDVCGKLRPNLVILMGNAGFGAVLSRAFALASESVPWLRVVNVRADGSLEGLDELEGQVDPEAIAEGRVVLVANLLGLLVTFIGEGLTLRLFHDVWPNLTLGDLYFSK